MLSYLHFPKTDFGLPTCLCPCRERGYLLPCTVNQLGSNSLFHLVFVLELPTGNKQRSLPLKHLATLLMKDLHCTKQETHPANSQKLVIDLDC